MRRLVALLACAVAVSALTLTACGSSSPSHASDATSPANTEVASPSTGSADSDDTEATDTEATDTGGASEADDSGATSDSGGKYSYDATITGTLSAHLTGHSDSLDTSVTCTVGPFNPQDTRTQFSCPLSEAGDPATVELDILPFKGTGAVDASAKGGYNITVTVFQGDEFNEGDGYSATNGTLTISDYQAPADDGSVGEVTGTFDADLADDDGNPAGHATGSFTLPVTTRS